MSDDLVKRGYADGKYVCSCRKCEGTFMGDKRAWCCKGCAVSADHIEELEERAETLEELVMDVVADLREGVSASKIDYRIGKVMQKLEWNE